jgi:hypothetical protein
MAAARKKGFYFCYDSTLRTVPHDVNYCPELKSEINVFSKTRSRFQRRPLPDARNGHSCAKWSAHIFMRGTRTKWAERAEHTQPDGVTEELCPGKDHNVKLSHQQ